MTMMMMIIIIIIIIIIIVIIITIHFFGTFRTFWHPVGHDKSTKAATQKYLQKSNVTKAWWGWHHTQFS